MKKQNVSNIDKSAIKIQIVLFFGLACLLDIEQCSRLFKAARHPKSPGLRGWLQSRVALYLGTPMWQSIHSRWVELADTEGLVKDAFFSVNTHFGQGVENPLENCAVKKWLTFLTDPSSEYHKKMVYRLAIGCPCWTEPETQANLQAKARLDEFAMQMVVNAQTVIGLRHAWYYVREGSLVEASAIKRLAQLEQRHEMQYAGEI